MANLEIVSNVLHKGIILKTGMIISDAGQGLEEVGQDLIDRGLAKPTDQPPTHTTTVVNGSQEALPIGTTTGQAPNVEGDEARKAQATAAQQQVTPQVAQAVQDQSAVESAPVIKQRMPTAADVEGV